MSTSGQELDVGQVLRTGVATRDWLERLADAVDGASDQGQATWLTDGGKRIAALGKP